MRRTDFATIKRGSAAFPWANVDISSGQVVQLGEITMFHPMLERDVTVSAPMFFKTRKQARDALDSFFSP